MNSARAMRTPLVSLLVGLAICALLLVGGCDQMRQDMATQPKNRPLSPSDFQHGDRTRTWRATEKKNPGGAVGWSTAVDGYSCRAGPCRFRCPGHAGP